MLKCEKCGKNISEKEDANVLALLGLVPTTFCNNCYSSKERGIERHFFYFPQFPINSKMFPLTLIVFTIFVSFISISMLSYQGSAPVIILIPFLLILVFTVLWEWVLYLFVRKRLSSLK